MKKLLGILGIVVGAGLVGQGIATLVKKDNDTEDDGYVCPDSEDEEDDEVDDELESEED